MGQYIPAERRAQLLANPRVRAVSSCHVQMLDGSIVDEDAVPPPGQTILVVMKLVGDCTCQMQFYRRHPPGMHVLVPGVYCNGGKGLSIWEHLRWCPTGKWE